MTISTSDVVSVTSTVTNLNSNITTIHIRIMQTNEPNFSVQFEEYNCNFLNSCPIPSKTSFSNIDVIAKQNYFQQLSDDDVHYVLNQHAELDFNRANSLKQYSPVTRKNENTKRVRKSKDRQYKGPKEKGTKTINGLQNTTLEMLSKTNQTKTCGLTHVFLKGKQCLLHQ